MNVHKIISSFLTLILVFASLEIFFFGVGSKSIVYANYDCGNGCQSYGIWNGTTYGSGANFTTSDPLVSGSDVFSRYIELDNGKAYVLFGIIKGNSGICNNFNTVDYFYYAVDANGHNVGEACQQVPTAQINQIENLSVNNYTSGGGGMLFHFPTAMSQCGDGTHNYCFQSGVPQSYGSIKVDEFINKSVSGHWVWGGFWSNFQWVGSNGTYAYQTRDFDTKFHFNQSTPPQMYWNGVPNGTNHGGAMLTCDYESWPGFCTGGQ